HLFPSVGVCSYSLPVVVFRAVVGQPQRLATVREGYKIETSIACQILGGGYATRKFSRRRNEPVRGLSEPDPAAARTGSDQVNHAVVVQIRDQQPPTTRFEVVRKVGSASNLRGLPGLPAILIREPQHHAVRP